MSPNHRAVDVVVSTHTLSLITIQSKFFYGPLNMATLSGEMVSELISVSMELWSLEAVKMLNLHNNYDCDRVEWHESDMRVSAARHGTWIEVSLIRMFPEWGMKFSGWLIAEMLFHLKPRGGGGRGHQILVLPLWNLAYCYFGNIFIWSCMRWLYVT